MDLGRGGLKNDEFENSAMLEMFQSLAGTNRIEGQQGNEDREIKPEGIKLFKNNPGDSFKIKRRTQQQ